MKKRLGKVADAPRYRAVTIFGAIACGHRHKSFPAAYRCGVQTFAPRGKMFDVEISDKPIWRKFSQ